MAPEPPDAPEPPGAPEAPDPPEPPEARERPDPDRTANRAVLVVARPEAFVNTARYSWPSSEVSVLAIVSCSAVAPGTALQVPPPSIEVSHCTVGAGKPDPVASNTALWPSSTVTCQTFAVISARISCTRGD